LTIDRDSADYLRRFVVMQERCSDLRVFRVGLRNSSETEARWRTGLHEESTMKNRSTRRTHDEEQVYMKKARWRTGLHEDEWM